MRLYELAKKHGKKSKDLLELADGLDIKSHLSTVEEDEVRTIEERLLEKLEVITDEVEEKVDEIVAEAESVVETVKQEVEEKVERTTDTISDAIE